MFRLAEYGPPIPMIGDLAAHLSCDPGEAERQLRRVGERLQAQHGLSSPPLEITAAGVTVKRIAGSVAVAGNAELEIRPKFAGEGDDWQEDLLFLALFTVYGHLDVIRTVSAATTTQNTMADLIGRILLGMINLNSRRPLKTRRATVIQSFEPLGELDLDTLLNPEEDGWVQRTYQMSLDNEWWATIHAGIASLLPHMRDPSVGVPLRDLLSRWGRPQTRPSIVRKTLPPRFASWQTAYDLAYELMRGASTAPSVGPFSTFGFTVDMWRVWEALIERALVMAIGASRVRLQHGHAFGSTIRGSKAATLEVFPDAVVRDAAGLHIIDAKYKGRHDTGFEGISAADRYEVLAFMHAVGTDRASLLYPSLEAAKVGDDPSQLETSTVPLGTVRALALGIRGIGKPAGLHSFVQSIAAAVDEQAPAPTS